MKIHMILSGEVRSYLGLKPNEVKPVAEIPSKTHWYAVWRMDLWPNELAGLPEQTDCGLLIMVNKETRFALLEMDQPCRLNDFKGNVCSYLQWPLHLGSFPGESCGSMEIEFYRGVERSLATSMKDMRERAGMREIPQSDHPGPAEIDRILSNTREWLNDVPLRVNDYESGTEMMRKMILKDPPTFFPSKFRSASDLGTEGKIIPFPRKKQPWSGH